MKSILKIKRYISRRVFYYLYARMFKNYQKTTYIKDPDIIEGHQYISLGDGVVIQTMAWLLAYKQDNIDPIISIEDGSVIGRFSHIVALRSIAIGKNVLIADKVYISDNIHAYEDITKPILQQEIVFKGDVEIGDNSWIGENVSIIGAKIGVHCIVGANAVVLRDIPSYSVVVGNPAKVIKTYNHDKEIWEKIE